VTCLRHAAIGKRLVSGTPTPKSYGGGAVASGRGVASSCHTGRGGTAPVPGVVAAAEAGGLAHTNVPAPTLPTRKPSAVSRS
jgi:hypothetical protein